MDNSENVEDGNFTPNSPASYLTRDQEHEIMVSTLRQVMISNRGFDTSSSHRITNEALPPPDAGPCPICGVTGCHGCAFPRHQEIKEEKKHKGVRKKPSGKWSAEIWDPSTKARKWLGMFPTAEMAAHAYNEEAAQLVGRRSARRGGENGEGSSHQKDGVGGD